MEVFQVTHQSHCGPSLVHDTISLLQFETTAIDVDMRDGSEKHLGP